MKKVVFGACFEYLFPYSHSTASTLITITPIKFQIQLNLSQGLSNVMKWMTSSVFISTVESLRQDNRVFANGRKKKNFLHYKNPIFRAPYFLYRRQEELLYNFDNQLPRNDAQHDTDVVCNLKMNHSPAIYPQYVKPKSRKWSG